MKGTLRHVGIVVKDLKQATHTYCGLGFKIIEKDTIKIVKLADSKGNVVELLKGKWKSHIAIDLYEDDAGNLVEVVKDVSIR